MTIARTPADLVIASARMAAGKALGNEQTPAPDGPTLGVCVANGDIITLAGTDGVLWAHADETGQWYVSHVYGSALRWRTLFKETCVELVARGFGLANVKWSASGPVASVAKTAFRIAKVGTDGRYSFTPKAGLVKLP